MPPYLFDPPSWGRHAAMALVLVGFVLLVAAFLPAGRIKAAARHPMIVAVGMWALGHLLANGDLAALLLFGAFLVYAAVYLIAAASRGDPAPAVVSPRSDLGAIAGGAVAYFAVLWLHPLLFGVSPIA